MNENRFRTTDPRVVPVWNRSEVYTVGEKIVHIDPKTGRRYLVQVLNEIPASGVGLTPGTHYS